VRPRRRPVQPEPATRRTTRIDAPEPGAALRRPSTFTSRALILLLVVAVLGVSYASSIRAWLNQRNEQSALSAQIAAQRAQISALQAAKARWNDPAYIEAQARLRFGWVMPGERTYRVIGKDGKVLSAGTGQLLTSLPGSASTQAPWWDRTLNSLVQAGSTPPAKKAQKPVHPPAKFIGPARGPTGR
jgi:cell division protein FtsB